MNPKMMQKIESRKNEISDVAFRLFVLNGVGDTSIRDISNELGISIGALYHYFKSKQDIIDSIATKPTRNLSHLQDYYMSLGNIKPTEALKKCIAYYLTMADESKNLTLFLDREYRSISPEIRLIMDNISNNLLRFFEQLISEGVRHGEFKSQYSKLAATLIFAVTHQWASDRLRYQDKANINEFATIMADLIVGAILV